MSSGIQGQILEVTVLGCNKLKNTEWITRQDPYVCLEYGSTKFRSKTCRDGGKNPSFQEKFVFTLVEGLRDLNAVVWNSNTLKSDDLIGSGKVQLAKVLMQGYDDSPWPLQTKKGKNAGEIRLILNYPNARQRNPGTLAPSAPPPYGAQPVAPQASPYPARPRPSAAAYPRPPPPAAATYPRAFPNPSYPPQTARPPPQTACPPPQTVADPELVPVFVPIPYSAPPEPSSTYDDSAEADEYPGSYDYEAGETEEYEYEGDHGEIEEYEYEEEGYESD